MVAAEWERSMNSKERGHDHSHRSQLALASITNGPSWARTAMVFHFLRSSRRDDILASRAVRNGTHDL
jgi:hypothetical protein